MLEISVRGCFECPFAYSYYQGIFLRSYCTAGLYMREDWRRFTIEELAEGMTEPERQKLKPLAYPRRTPKLAPGWCKLKNGITLLVPDDCRVNQ